MILRLAATFMAVLVAAAPAAAQYYQTDFPSEEFKARHARVFEQIGSNAVAVVQGMPQTEGYTYPRQHNTFYYLSGIETPVAYLLLDGRRSASRFTCPRAIRGWKPQKGGFFRPKTWISSSGSRGLTR